jgi:opacity protein-like surface antigen
LINGLPYNDLDVTSGFSFGFTAGYYFNEHMEVEFLFNRQSSTFQASNPSPALKVSDLGVFNYHGNFVYNWGTHDSPIRPYAFGGLGATHYSPSNDLLPPLGPNTTPTISSTTRFSTTWGGGVKFYPAKAVGARVGLRWTPTYIQSNAAGYWCDPWYGCWIIGSAEYSQQFEFSGGITVRFNFHQ